MSAPFVTDEDRLVEETFELIQALDDTDDPTEAALLEARIADRADDIGELQGHAVRDIHGELLVACLDESQAVAIQSALLLACEGGFVTKVERVSTGIADFVHPHADPVKIAVFLAAEGEG